MAVINGNNGSNNLFGTNVADTIRGKGGNDKIFAGGGNDKAYGDDGNDTVNGEAGNDTLYGGKGNDILKGSFGNDTYWGGAGKDKFGFQIGSGFLAQTDTIKDFQRGDKIALGQYKSQLFDYLDDNNDGALDAADDNVFDYGVGLELDMSGWVGTTAVLNVEKVEELNAADFIV